MTEQETRLWESLREVRGEFGVPRVLCSAITPFPFWAVIASIVIFIPLALLLSFAVKRHALLVQGEELVIVELGFWRMQPRGEARTIPLAGAEVSLDGSALVVADERYHLQPGWNEQAERIVALAG